MTHETTIERAELYERVWTTPMKRVAKELGISDVALAKICRKLRVPRPSRDHWAKVRHGTATKRPELPALTEGQPDSVVVHATEPAEPWEARRRPAPQMVPLADGPVSRPLVRRTGQALRGAKPHYRDGLLWVGADEGALAVRVSGAAKDRALRLLDALLGALEKRGWRVEVDAKKRKYDWPATFAIVNDAHIHFHLRELSRRVAREPTDWERRGDGSTGQTDRQYTALVPSGDLQIELSGDFYGPAVRRVWSERSRKGKRLEARLGELVVEFEVAADAVRARREEARRADEERRRREADEERARHRRAHAQALAEDLLTMAGAWAKATEVHAFLEAARDRVARAGLAGEELEAWFAWAERYAARLDPLSVPAGIAKRLQPRELPTETRPRWGAAAPPAVVLEPAAGGGDPKSYRGGST